MGWGSIGGSSSKKSTTNNNDNRALMAAGNSGQAVMGEGNVVNVLDGGAINDAFAFANGAFEYADTASDRAFEAIDDASAAAFAFANGAFESALAQSDAARAESYNAVAESNRRIDEAYAGYRKAGRESEAESLSIIKILAVMVGVGVIAVGVSRA